MSSRFHNKWHRYNHHSIPTPGVPDSAKDPIASSQEPFRGEFIISGGPLSAHYPQGPYAAYFDNNIYVRDSVHTQNLSADFIDVNYIDVRYYETSGFGISGSDYNCVIPTNWHHSDTLTLDGIGLSGSSWAALDGNVRVGKNLQTSSIIPKDADTFNHIIMGCQLASACGDLDFGSIGSELYSFDTTSDFGLKVCGDISANAIFGLLNTAETELMLSSTECTFGSFWDTTLWSNNMNGDGMVVLTTEASGSDSYAVVEGYTDGILAAKMVVGNPGNTTNSLISHPLSAETILDNKQVMTYPLITNKDYEIRVVESHGPVCHMLRVYQYTRDVNITDLTINQNLVVNNSAFFGDNIDLNCNDIVNVDTVQANVIELIDTCGTIGAPPGIDFNCGSILDVNLIAFGNCPDKLLDMNSGAISDAETMTFGDPETDGSWQLSVSADDAFTVSKRVSGSWVRYITMT